MQIKIISLVVVIAMLFANITNAQNVKQKEEVIIIKKDNNEKQVTIKVDGNKMTINGKPVSDSVKNSILKENAQEIKSMKVIVDGDNITINGKPTNEKTRIIERKIIKDGNEEKITVVVENDSVFINGKPVDASEFNGNIFLNGKTNSTNDVNNFGKKEIRINSNHNFNMPEQFQMKIDQPKMMLGVVVGKDEKGLIIKQVIEESAAASAGLKVDDIITKFNGTFLVEPKQLVDSVQNKKPGDAITLMVIKAGEKKETKLSIKFNKQNASNQVRVFVEGEGPNDDGAVIEKDIQRQLHKLDLGNGMPGKRIFIQKMPFNENFRDLKLQKPLLGIQVQETKDSSGVIVLKVMEGSLGEISGVKENDVITAINGEKIIDIQTASKLLDVIKEKSSFQLKVKRNGNFINIDIKKPAKLRKAVL